MVEIDGHAIEQNRLTSLVDAALRSADSIGLGPGSGLAIAADDQVGILVAAEVARRAGAAIVHTRKLRAALEAERDPRWALLWTDAGAAGVTLEPATVAESVELPAAAGALLWTSGTDSSPRMVILSRAGLDYQARATAERLGVDNGDALLLPLPLDHSYGFSVVELARASGAHLYVESGASPQRILRRLRSTAIDMVDGFPSLYRRLLGIAARDPLAADLLRAPRLLGCGGDVLSESLAADFLELVGAPLFDGYGLTEAGPNVALSAPGCHRLGCTGPPLAGTEIRLADDGELLVRSPNVTLGYLGDEAATRCTLDDGWLRTGDLATLSDDGYVTIMGRKKHVLVVHGDCYPPRMVEDAALAANQICEAVAVGRPAAHPKGDHITLFVVAERGHEKGVRSEAREACYALPVHLRPHAIEVLDELPRGVTGKPDRDALRRMAESL